MRKADTKKMRIRRLDLRKVDMDYQELNKTDYEFKHLSSNEVAFIAVNSDQNLATPCGLFCGECLYYGKPCRGCVPSEGRPSWGKCKTYACTVEKEVEHCGMCTEFPCSLFLSQYSRVLGPWRVFYKAGQLLYRKKIGIRAWVKEKERGKNVDPKVVVERCFEREQAQKKKQHAKKK